MMTLKVCDTQTNHWNVSTKLLSPSYSTTPICLAPINKKHSANRARWVKFVILLYNYDIETGHCLLNASMPSEAFLVPETSTDPSVENYLPWEDLETAQFGSIFLTQIGTMLYCGYNGPYMLVDALGLQNVAPENRHL
ncbi:hypothetical protein PEBR_07911 [Penicillium brasilianum]|uniref:Uncharacterized protein n=1 Tax=Penicillium brasilianum TaxID=104259 RepID=A0A1S9RVK0_PENBI|nr:hypothetical protein PEBR_07911 [Penicillium brasilianum]